MVKCEENEIPSARTKYFGSGNAFSLPSPILFRGFSPVCVQKLAFGLPPSSPSVCCGSVGIDYLKPEVSTAGIVCVCVLYVRVHAQHCACVHLFSPSFPRLLAEKADMWRGSVIERILFPTSLRHRGFGQC